MLIEDANGHSNLQAGGVHRYYETKKLLLRVPRGAGRGMDEGGPTSCLAAIEEANCSQLFAGGGKTYPTVHFCNERSPEPLGSVLLYPLADL